MHESEYIFSRIHEDYATHSNHETYRTQMSTVTRGFTELSKEVIYCIAIFKDQRLDAIAAILSQLQVQEKEKLELVSWVRDLVEVNA